TFQITDTGVSAVNDTGGSVVEGSGASNSVTGVLANDTLGQDAASVSQIATSNGAVNLVNGIATIASSYQNGGQLVIHSDGTYTYTPPSHVQNPHTDPNNPNVATPVTDTYTYTLTDADGSRSTATLTFQITDTGVSAVNDTGGSVVEGSGAINSVTGVLAND